MTGADRVVERAASRLAETAGRWSAENGWKSKLAEPLADDAEFLRKLKPSLIRARIKGGHPTDETPSPPTIEPAEPRPGKRAKAKGTRTGGPNPLVVVGVAFAVGVVLAKVIDWRGHAHPRN